MIMETERDLLISVFLIDSRNSYSNRIKKASELLAFFYYYPIISLAFFKALSIPDIFDPPAVAKKA